MKAIVCVLAVSLLLSSLAVAAERDPLKVDNASPMTVASRADCCFDDYMLFSDPADVSVPDCDPYGVWIGPLATEPGYEIQDVALFLDMRHTWIGDLIVYLLYDADCDGTPDATGGVLCRPDFDGCPVDACCGCGGDLDGVYEFDDAAASVEDDCGTLFAAGCYGPDYDSPGLGAFNGFNTGGYFWLHAIDTAAGDEGTIFSWEVRILGEAATPAVGALDILPASCPNPFNVKAKGKLPVAVLGSESFDAEMVDPASVELAGVAPTKWSFVDVATPLEQAAEHCACSDLGEDGYTDLVLHFMRQDLVQAMGPVSDGDMVELTLSGLMADGTPFSVSDCVLILSKGNGNDAGREATGDEPNSREAVESTTWGAIKAHYR
jgi:subtilisin-like proprotein convertase family protein